MGRQWPNILITGTPGTGKTISFDLDMQLIVDAGKSTHCAQLVENSQVPLKYINVGDLVKQKALHEGWNEEWQSYDVDEDKLLDELETVCGNDQGGVILDWHACELFPERWLDLVIVLTCDHSILWERLEKRKYSLQKIQENNQAEIMQVILNEAHESYPNEIVIPLSSESTEEIDTNVDRIQQWIANWKADQE